MEGDKAVGNAKSDLFQGVAKAQFGYKLLQQMGWEEGKGLGVAENGITEHIRVRKKSNGAGIGLDKASKEKMDWTANTSVFDNILRNLSEVKTDSPKADGAMASKQPPPSSSEDESVEEEVKPKKIARHQGRYHKHQKAKLTHSYSGEHLNEILGGARSSEDADKLAVPARAPVATASRHDAAAVYAGDGDGSVKKRKKGASSAEEATPWSTGDAATTTVGRPPLSKGVPAPARPGIGASTAPAPTTNPAWWGAKFGFVKGPTIGSGPSDGARKDAGTEGGAVTGPAAGVAAPGKKGHPLGFTESDQENLYTHAQEHAIKGKRGLGMDGEGRPMKKSKWAGSKVTFGDASSSGDEASQDESTDRGSPPRREERGSAITTTAKAERRPSRETKAGPATPVSAAAGGKAGQGGASKKAVGKVEEPPPPAPQPQAEQQGDWARRIKWKKMIARALEQEPTQSLKLRRLQERVLAMVVQKHGDHFEASRACPQKATESAVLEQVNSSSRFVVKGKRVSLSSGSSAR